ncbi:peptidase M15D vanX D-ala-D-ala dipeptidase [Cellulophaga geojensis KL-A]|uniref:D-alanyl-D-alanine dipeptidase n=1 Tax=Cellulophaga geojensis KL-A TaxID=1328323 RepID=A0ABN0RQC3_9FLAO|nr:M15 family metallopeptidase [Cellulophaga geojensis]EWH14075.1 peptidase M15D vanX D-ala-D-ala dipeptidase [Cellulophaga geojensis KL-A]
MKPKHLLLLLLICITIACKNNKTTAAINIVTKDTTVVKKDTVLLPPVKQEIKYKSLSGLADTTFVRLADYSGDFAYDLRYATTNNFLKAKVYDCPECYTRVKTAKALLKVNKEFVKLGYRIKFFDCYRPNSVQYKMWKIVPNPQYVANPKKGSIHNKGGAVDITLETLDGEEVDMGTDFDFFGKRAYHDNTNLPKEILANRKLLKETMEKYGFWSIRTEWWHYNLSAMSNAKVANFKWDCGE